MLSGHLFLYKRVGKNLWEKRNECFSENEEAFPAKKSVFAEWS